VISAKARVFVVVVAGMGLTACGDKGGPAGPTTSPTTTAVTVSVPAGTTVFIGSAVQLSAQETLNNGTTRPAQNPVWSSSNPAVATVSASGVVTGVAAGEVTISARATAVGTLVIRVYPSFGGTWDGPQVARSCVDAGVWSGICQDPDFLVIGEQFLFHATMTQADASVDAVIDLGGGTTVSATGQVSVDGELQLPATAALPENPPLVTTIENWRSRSDVLRVLTGTYDLVFTSPDPNDIVRIGLELQNVPKTFSPAAVTQRSSNPRLIDAARIWLESHRVR